MNTPCGTGCIDWWIVQLSTVRISIYHPRFRTRSASGWLDGRGFSGGNAGMGTCHRDDALLLVDRSAVAAVFCRVYHIYGHRGTFSHVKPRWKSSMKMYDMLLFSFWCTNHRTIRQLSNERWNHFKADDTATVKVHNTEKKGRGEEKKFRGKSFWRKISAPLFLSPECFGGTKKKRKI